MTYLQIYNSEVVVIDTEKKWSLPILSSVVKRGWPCCHKYSTYREGAIKIRAEGDEIRGEGAGKR